MTNIRKLSDNTYSSHRFKALRELDAWRTENICGCCRWHLRMMGRQSSIPSEHISWHAYCHRRKTTFGLPTLSRVELLLAVERNAFRVVGQSRDLSSSCPIFALFWHITINLRPTFAIVCHFCHSTLQHPHIYWHLYTLVNSPPKTSFNPYCLEPDISIWRQPFRVIPKRPMRLTWHFEGDLSAFASSF
jgi:hypothetical protein